MVLATLASLTHASEAVVVGTVTGFRGCLDADTDSIVTEITLAVERGVKAPVPVAPGTELTFDVPGGRYGGYLLAVGTSPEFAAGERVVVFLRRAVAGSLRLTEDHQGKFSVTPAGTIARIGMSLDAFAAKVKQAENGTPPPRGIRSHPARSVAHSPRISRSHRGPRRISRSRISSTRAPVGPRSSAAQTENAFNNAFDAWENDPGSTIAFTFAGNTTRLSGADGCPGFDGNNDLTWGIADPGHSAGTLAITYTCYTAITSCCSTPT